MATLRDLHRAIFPGARPAGGGVLEPEQGNREVAWVRVLKARVPAFDALEHGELAIIPGPSLAVVAAGRPQTGELAAALARANVPAVLLVEGDGGDEALDELAAEGLRAGLTVLRMGRTDPVALERSVIGFLVNRRAELDRRAAQLEGQLARLALLGRGLDVLAAAIGAFLGRAVVIEGGRGDPIAVHAPADLVDAATAVTRYLARPASAALRVPIPAPAGDPAAGGHLVLLGDDPPADLERIAGERIAALLALELARDTAVRHAREETRRGAPLPEDGPPWVVLLARQVAVDVAGPGGAPAFADDGSLREATRRDLQRMMSPRRLTLRGSAESLELRLVAATDANDPEGLVVAGRIAAYLERTVAVSRPFTETAARPAAEAAARTTLEAAEQLHEPPAVVRAARLPAYLLLSNLHNLPDGLTQARELLAPVMTGRPAVQGERLATLRAVLETSSLGEAAARLGVHRNTVAYRVARLETLGGWDLSDPDLRFVLSLAVRLVQNAQA